ncbi:CoA transferase [Pusillimonas sp. TS35]|nr:CoA transferase [Pusillimonas sp. TS35]
MINTSTPEPSLAGLQVLDFSELLPGPFFTQNLLELGASITKVERPPNGDGARLLYPGVFESVNRGKQSIMLNLKDPADLEQARSLVKAADILVEGYRPGVMARLGLDYETARALNPRIVYVSLSGYGQTGPNSKLPGHDLNYLAMAGALALGGSDREAPGSGAGLSVADLAGAMYALASTLAALIARERTNQGRYLDVSLTDCIAHWMNPRLGQFRYSNQTTLSEQRSEVLSKPAYGVFSTSDGGHVAIAALEDHFWSRLKTALSLGPFGDDTSYALRSRMADHINGAIAARVRSLSEHQTISALQAADVPVSTLVLPSQLVTSEHVRNRGLADEDAGFLRYPVNMNHVHQP